MSNMELFGMEAGNDIDQPVDSDGNIKYREKRADLEMYRQILATIPKDKIRPFNMETGEIFQPERDAEGKIKNKNRAGRGKIEWDRARGFELAVADDPDWNVKVTAVPLGVNRETGIHMTQLQVKWVPRGTMSPQARVGTTGRQLKDLLKKVEQNKTLLLAKPDDPELKEEAASLEDRVAKKEAELKKWVAVVDGLKNGPKPAAPAEKPAAPAAKPAAPAAKASATK